MNWNELVDIFEDEIQEPCPVLPKRQQSELIEEMKRLGVEEPMIPKLWRNWCRGRLKQDSFARRNPLLAFLRDLPTLPGVSARFLWKKATAAIQELPEGTREPAARELGKVLPLLNAEGIESDDIIPIGIVGETLYVMARDCWASMSALGKIGMPKDGPLSIYAITPSETLRQIRKEAFR